MAEDFKVQMQSAGVTDPACQAAAEHAMAAGVERGQLLDWIRKYGPSIFEVIRKLLELRGGGGVVPPVPPADSEHTQIG